MRTTRVLRAASMRLAEANEGVGAGPLDARGRGRGRGVRRAAGWRGARRVGAVTSGRGGARHRGRPGGAESVVVQVAWRRTGCSKDRRFGEGKEKMSDTNTNIIEYEYKTDISNSDSHSNT
jgi:hypothetical protein